MLPSKKPIFKILTYLSEEYKRAVSLREEILRKPLGVLVSQKEIEDEKNHVHIGGFIDLELCATCALIDEGKVLKIQRVAVREAFQNQGIGTALIQFCEDYAKTHQFESISCFSKKKSVQFYLKNQFVWEEECTGPDGNSYQKMRKILHR